VQDRREGAGIAVGILIEIFHLNPFSGAVLALDDHDCIFRQRGLGQIAEDKPRRYRGHQLIDVLAVDEAVVVVVALVHRLVEELHLIAVAVADLVGFDITDIDRPRGLAGADLTRLFGQAGTAVAECGRLGHHHHDIVAGGNIARGIDRDVHIGLGGGDVLLDAALVIGIDGVEVTPAVDQRGVDEDVHQAGLVAEVVLDAGTEGVLEKAEDTVDLVVDGQRLDVAGVAVPVADGAGVLEAGIGGAVDLVALKIILVQIAVHALFGAAVPVESDLAVAGDSAQSGLFGGHGKVVVRVVDLLYDILVAQDILLVVTVDHGDRKVLLLTGVERKVAAGEDIVSIDVLEVAVEITGGRFVPHLGVVAVGDVAVLVKDKTGETNLIRFVDIGVVDIGLAGQITDTGGRQAVAFAGIAGAALAVHAHIICFDVPVAVVVDAIIAALVNEQVGQPLAGEIVLGEIVPVIVF